MVFRCPFCAPGAHAHILTWHSIPYSQSIADFSEQSTVPIPQAAQESSSAQVTRQSQGQLLAQASPWTVAADCRAGGSPDQGGFWSLSAEEGQGMPASRRNNKILRKSNNKFYLQTLEN